MTIKLTYSFLNNDKSFTTLATLTIHPDGSYESAGAEYALMLTRQSFDPDTHTMVSFEENPFAWARGAPVTFGGTRFYIDIEEVSEESE